MQKQPVDHLLFETPVSTTSLEFLTRCCVVNCKCESKSSKTILGYEMMLNNFAWYCCQNNYPEVQKLSCANLADDTHLRGTCFLNY